MRHSIKKQFALTYIAVTAVTIFCCCLLNRLLLESYYINRKETEIYSVYETLNSAFADGRSDTEDFDVEIQNLCSKYNVSMLVLDENLKPLKATMFDTDQLILRMSQYIFSNDGNQDVGKTLKSTKDYVLRSVFDIHAHTGHLEMLGFLDSGNMFILTTPREGIRESVKISNAFLINTGLLAILVGSVVIWIVSKKITEPILDLAKISEKMTHLDFETKYEGSQKNEIGILGENINKLSMALEENISVLKTANNELQKDVEKRQRIDDMRKEFLSNVSHELKTPIALIQGYAEGLKENINDDEESRNFYCEVIMDESSRMNELVQKLLTLNQLEFGNNFTNMERFDLSEVLKSFCQSASILTKQNGIELRLETNEHCYVWADEYWVEEVIRNYFSNALHHCGKEKLIEIKVKETGDKAHVSIFNTGDPIPEEALPHIWEKFFKVDKARTREYGGSGIGLSIVKAIMESMNADCGVENYENGVAFWFELAMN